MKIVPLFPKAFLYKKYNGNNSIHKALINEIANIAFITQESNMEILARDPQEYLPKIDATQLRMQFVPTDEKLYNLENYEQFLAVRRELLCNGINKFLATFFSEGKQIGVPEDLGHYDKNIEQIELALRDLISHKLNNAAELDAYKELVPEHLKEKVEGKIKSWITKNPGEDKTQFLILRRKMDFFDLQEYFDLISAKLNWIFFEETFGSKSNLQSRFSQLGELRNSIRHSRGATEVAIKDGEAAIAWFNSILRSTTLTIESKEIE